MTDDVYNHDYPIAINGIIRTTLGFLTNKSNIEIQKELLENDNIIRLIGNKNPKKIIIVPKRIINIILE